MQGHHLRLPVCTAAEVGGAIICSHKQTSQGNEQAKSITFAEPLHVEKKANSKAAVSTTLICSHMKKSQVKANSVAVDIGGAIICTHR